MEEQGATVVITHRVPDEKHGEYEAWLNEIGPICRASKGILDWQVVRPIPGISSMFTIILRYDTREHLQEWMDSAERRRLIEKVQVIARFEDRFFVNSGLDFWFVPQGAKAQVPVRWKQFLLTWSAIFPLVLMVPLFIMPLLQRLGLPENRYLGTFWVSGTVVALMVYVVMPRYTRLVRRWLFKGGEDG